MRQARRRREPGSSREGPLQRALAVASAPAQRAPGPILVVANFTAAIAVAVVDAVTGGAAVALAVGIAFGTSLAVAVVIGAATAVIAVGAALRYQHTRREAGTLHPVLFPGGAPLGARPHRGLLFRFGLSVTSDALEMVPTGRRADSH